MMLNDNVGKRIKERRIEIGLSAAQLADRLNMSKATIFGNSQTKTIDEYRDFYYAVVDIKSYLETVKNLTYRDHIMDEQDMIFLRSWIFVIETHFDSRYK